MSFRDLCPVNAAHRSAGPDAGEWHEKKGDEMASRNAEFETIPAAGEPSAFGRAGKIDGCGRSGNGLGKTGGCAATPAEGDFGRDVHIRKRNLGFAIGANRLGIDDVG